jgi:hypothetical protein
MGCDGEKVVERLVLVFQDEYPNRNSLAPDLRGVGCRVPPHWRGLLHVTGPRMDRFASGERRVLRALARTVRTSSTPSGTPTFPLNGSGAAETCFVVGGDVSPNDVVENRSGVAR